MVKRALLRIIAFYKKNISPLTPPACRFVPTCSEYTAQAIERFGAVRGCVMGFFRILRCNPLCKGGYDPVGERFTIRRYKEGKKEEK